MATRSIVEIGTVVVYRHWDGYVAEAGADLLDFIELERSGELKSGCRIGDKDYLAARFVAYLADKYRVEGGGPSDFLSVGVYAKGAYSDYGEEYRYRVTDDGSVRYQARSWGHRPGEVVWSDWQPLTREVVDREIAARDSRIAAAVAAGEL